MLEFSNCPFQVVEDNFQLVEQHWNEVVTDRRELAPHWEFFHEAERTGHLICFCASEGAQIKGYAVFVIQPDLHSRNILSAHNNAIFLHPDYRKTGTGAKFIKYCDEQLAKRGIDFVAWQVTPAVDFSRTLKAIGYFEFSTIYGRNVKV